MGFQTAEDSHRGEEMVRKERYEEKEKLRGGEGIVRYYHVLTEEELNGHGRMFAKLVLPPGASIGWHQHVGETEPYYILKGEADFTDNDGTVTHVVPGDCCLIEVGQSHSIANNGDEDVEFMALIYNE